MDGVYYLPMGCENHGFCFAVFFDISRIRRLQGASKFWAFTYLVTGKCRLGFSVILFGPKADRMAGI